MNTPNQNPLPNETKKTGNAKKIIGGIILAIVVVGGKLALKFGAGYGLVEAEVAASKYEKWPEDFKQSFIGGCESQSQPGTEQIMKKFCNCIADRIENAHILNTKYNSISKTEQELANDYAAKIQEYMATPDGKKNQDECLKTAGVNIESDREVAQAQAPAHESQ